MTQGIKKSLCNLLTALLLSPVAPLFLTAQEVSQEELSVEVGDEFEYENISTREFKGRGESADLIPPTRQERGMTMLLRVDSILSEQIYWTTQAYAVAAGFQGKGLGMTMSMVTDRSGTLQRLGVKVPGADTMMIVDMKKRKVRLSDQLQWFLPKEITKMKVGESWSIEKDNEVEMNLMGESANGKGGGRTTYTYGGIVDTLGMKLYQLSWKEDSSAASGEMPVPGSGQKLRIDGEGDGNGVSYYTVDNRLKYAEREEKRSRLTVWDGEEKYELDSFEESEMVRQD